MKTIDQANMPRRLYHWLIASGYTPETPLNAIQITPELVSGRGAMVARELLRLATQHLLPVPDAVWRELLGRELDRLVKALATLSDETLAIGSGVLAERLQPAQALLDLYHARPRPKRGRPRGTTSSAAAERREKIRQMRAAGLSVEQIMREVGCGKSTIYAALKTPGD